MPRNVLTTNINYVFQPQNAVIICVDREPTYSVLQQSFLCVGQECNVCEHCRRRRDVNKADGIKAARHRSRSFYCAAVSIETAEVSLRSKSSYS
jgi:hypothetical protein